MKAHQLLPKPHSRSSAKAISGRKPQTCVSTNYQSHPPAAFQPSEDHFISLIHASKSNFQLRQIHGQIIRHNLSASSRVITQLISSCSLMKSMNYALSTFRYFDKPNLFVFNALIRALADNSRFESSVIHYRLMLRSNIQPDRLTFPFLLKSAAVLLDRRLGISLHCEVVKLGIEFESFVRVTLVDMYVKVEHINSALQVFDESSELNKLGSVLLWNVLINGCCKVGNLRKATELFDAMPERNAGSWNSLINGCIREGDVIQAMKLFDQMPEKNVVSWTTMVSGFSQIGDHEKALSMFFRMLKKGIRPNDLTIVSALSACAKLGALESGIQIHNYILENGFQLNREIGTALVDMYAKCGNVNYASVMFDKTTQKDLRTWSVMIWGLAIHGCFEQAVECFTNMKKTGIKPDDVVFLAVLTACTHSGRINDGLFFFDSMRFDYKIEPTIKHYTLVVDLFCRAGRLREALSFITEMPIAPDSVIWGALFCACRAHKNTEIAELASLRLRQLDPRHPGSYVFLSNIYAGAGKWEEVEQLRNSMKSSDMGKNPGWSHIELGGHVHSFVSGDHTHEHAEEIYSILEKIINSTREQGYIPETEWVLHNIEDEEKEGTLRRHSEKLAVA